MRENPYILLARILSLDISEEQREYVSDAFLKGRLDIEQFVTTADRHLVMPALFPILERHHLTGILHDELSAHLKSVFHLNSSRNQKVLEQVETLNGLFSQNGITPLYLKGTGNIIDNLYIFSGERILHDIDLLVSEEQFPSTVKLLLAHGYSSSVKADPDNPGDSKHYPILSSEDFVSYVEIHRMHVRKKYTSLFPMQEVFREAKKISEMNGCLVMSDEHKLIQNFITYLEDDSHYYARTSLRNIYDAMLLSSRVDAEQVFHEFPHFRKQTSDYLEVLYRLTGNNPLKKFRSFFYIPFHSLRHEINLSSSTAAKISYLLLRMFYSYVRKPFMSLYNKELRKSLVQKAADTKWYRRHFSKYFRE